MHKMYQLFRLALQGSSYQSLKHVGLDVNGLRVATLYAHVC